MILTGKAKEDFIKWNGDKDFEMMLPFEYPTYLNALIIEWFDSIGIWEDLFYREYRATKFQDYKRAITQATIKANKIYNERTKN